MDGFSWLTLVKYAGVLIAAIIIGNWFLAEVKKANRKQQPWSATLFICAGRDNSGRPEPAADIFADFLKP